MTAATRMAPVLYSFRRCPYAMRARLALHASGIPTELREVALRDKPTEMLNASAKGTVPVLVLPDGRVIDESWDIMLWALRQHDPDSWLGLNGSHVDAAAALVGQNDTVFKRQLDRYKYPERYPEYPQTVYRTNAEVFLASLEQRLGVSAFLLGDSCSVADVAIVPFIRQFARVDADWFAISPYALLRNWLSSFVESARFSAIMKKFPVWHIGDQPVIISPEQNLP